MYVCVCICVCVCAEILILNFEGNRRENKLTRYLKSFRTFKKSCFC